jgi:hypothetical protein
MASGHVNRIERPNTWLHRPMLQNVKKVLANPEPSTHGTSRHFVASQRMVAIGAHSGHSGKPHRPISICDLRSGVFPNSPDNGITHPASEPAMDSQFRSKP